MRTGCPSSSAGPGGGGITGDSGASSAGSSNAGSTYSKSISGSLHAVGSLLPTLTAVNLGTF
jgi:hypothetical protein